MQHSGFFNGEQEYGQEEFNRYFNHLYESGVSNDENGNMTLGVTKGNGKVTVEPGFAILQGFYYYNDSGLEMNISPDVNYSRIDRIVLRLNVLTGPVEVVVKKGTPGSSPAVPVLQRDNNIYEVSLAQVMVDTAGNLTVRDERFDTEVCGMIRPRNLTEYKAMAAEYQRRFEEWFASQQGLGWRNIFIQSEAPEEAVTGSIWIQTQNQ